MKHIKILVSIVAILLCISIATPANAAALTSIQIQAILSLLSSFGADATTINNVNAALTGQTTVPTPIPPTPTPIPLPPSDDETSGSGIVYSCPTLTRTLSRGDTDIKTNGEVSALQGFLSGYFNVNENIVVGFYGPKTVQYVKQFQKKNGLEQVGYVGKQTRAAIARACGGVTTPPSGTPAIKVDVDGSYFLNIVYSNLPLSKITLVSVTTGREFDADNNVSGSSVVNAADYHNKAGDSYYFKVTAQATGLEVARSNTFYIGSEKPGLSCAIWPSKSTYTLGETIVFNWTSTNATYAGFVIDTSGKDYLKVPTDKLPASGSQQVTANVLGNPSVTLAVYGKNNTTARCIATVNVTDTSSVIFSASPTSGAAPLLVTFKVTGNYINYSDAIIDFGDGESRELPYFMVAHHDYSSPLKAPHTYTSSGTYTATLIGRNTCFLSGQTTNCPTTPNTILGTVTITVGGTQSGTFSATPQSGPSPLTVNFSAPASLGGSSLDYGDGQGIGCTTVASESGGCNFSGSHTYTSAGTYTAKLMAGAKTIGTVTITVGVNRAGGITVTAPNGGEKWEIGQLNTITWAPYGYNPDVNPVSDVKAYLMKKVRYGTDDQYINVGEIVPGGKASIHWEGKILPPGATGAKYADPGEYYIDVHNIKTKVVDMSDAPFILLPRGVDIKVNGSDGPVTLADNQKVTVSIKTGADFANCTLHGMRVNPGGITPVISLGQAVAGGSSTSEGYAYAPPFVGDSPNAVAIHIICTKSDESMRTDIVEVNVLGGVASLRVVSPNGGEKIPLGQPYKIAWRQSGLSKVSIALYSFDQWKEWIVKDLSLDKDALDTYSYVWTPSPTDINSISKKIYITGQKADGTGYVDDKSDAPFGFSVAVTPISTSGPKKNAMSCAKPPKTGLGGGTLACYGLWDFGNEFGDDQNMCPTDSSGYTTGKTGCTISTSACQSGKATASRVVDIYSPWHTGTTIPLATSAEIDQYARNLNSTSAAVSKQIIRLWEYSCTGEPAPVATSCTYKSDNRTTTDTLSLTTTPSIGDCVATCKDYKNSNYGVADSGTCTYTANGTVQSVDRIVGTVLNGTLSVSLDPSSPAYKIVAAGSRDVLAAAYRLTNDGSENVALEQIAVQLSDPSSFLGDIEKASLWDGATKIGDAYFTNGRLATSTLLQPLTIYAKSDKVITIKADLSPIGSSQMATSSGHLVKIDFRSGAGRGATTGLFVSATGSTSVQGVRVMRSFPTVSVDNSLPTAGLVDGRLARFKILADPHGSIGIGQFVIYFDPSLVSLSNVGVYAYEDASYSMPVAGFASTGLITALQNAGGNFVLTQPLQIPAGATRYLEVRGTVSNVQSGATVVTSLAGSATYNGFSNLAGQGGFTWSPNSTTTASINNTDWTNGYGIPGLPSNGLIQTRTHTGTSASATNTSNLASVISAMQAVLDGLKNQLNQLTGH